MTTNQTAPAPAPAQQQPAPAKDKPAAKNKAKDNANPETLGGVLIPGGIITGLIGLCWLAHTFGLGVVIAALIACALAATALLAMRARRSVKAARRMARLGAGGAGPGRGGSPRRGGGRGATGGGSRGGSRGGGRGGSGGGSPRGGGRSRGGAMAPGPNARKPGGMGATKSPSGGLLGGTRNGGGKGKGSNGGAGSLLGAGPRGGGGKSPGTRRGLLGKMSPGGSGSHHSPRKPNAKNAPSKGKAGGLGGALGLAPKAGGGKGPKGKSPRLPSADKAAAKLLKASKANKGHDGGGKAPKLDKLTAKPKTKTTGKGGGKGSKRKAPKPRRVSYGAPMGPVRKSTYWAGAKLRKHTTRKTRMRIKKVVGPVRATGRAVGRASTPLAYAWRYTSHAFLSLHMALGSVRYTGAGPNWLKPLAMTLHACTSPFARAVAWSGSWSWLNTWIYTRTGGGRNAGSDRSYPTSVAEARPIRPHTPVTRPAAAAPPTTGGIPAMASDLTPALPLVAAIDAVRTAGVMLTIHPADDMVGYELTIRQLAELQYAIGDVVRQAANSTRENFKVNPAVPEAYDDTAAYMRAIGDRLAAIPYLFRMLHAEQLDNIANPTPAAAKWDIRANN